MTKEEIRKVIRQELRDEECRKMRLEMLREKARMDRKERESEEKMGITPSLEKRLEYLEADGSAQRTAISKLERAVFIHSCIVAVQGAAITWLIWKALT
jgi:uncharacterized coiled-coil protein SlyX